MWQAIAPVHSDYDPILYESHDNATLLILNAGPDPIYCRVWNSAEAGAYQGDPSVQLQLRSGDQRVVSGSLIRVQIIKEKYYFAAVAWTVLGS
jgi:hypothetical protein